VYLRGVTIRSQLAQLGSLALDALEGAAPGRERDDRLRNAPIEPPVIARFMVEIRSDGLHTVARGALEDRISGESHAVEAHGTTPAALAFSLARHLVTLPAFNRTLRRALGK
jgi:hypothetical protein